jgi:hypothetical protein
MDPDLICGVLERRLALLVLCDGLATRIKVNLVNAQRHASHVRPHEVCRSDLGVFAFQVRKVNVKVCLEDIILGLLVLLHCIITTKSTTKVRARRFQAFQVWNQDLGSSSGFRFGTRTWQQHCWCALVWKRGQSEFMTLELQLQRGQSEFMTLELQLQRGQSEFMTLELQLQCLISSTYR